MKKTKSKTNHNESTLSSLTKKQNKYLFLIPLLIGFAGFVLIFHSSSRNGIGISGDSVQYLMWARTLLENHSFTRPDGTFLIILPPFYSIFIACFKVLGIDDFFTARLISAIFFGLTVFFTGLWVLKYLRSLFFSIISSLLIFSEAIVSDCVWAWSEPLFLFFVGAFFFLLPKIPTNPKYKLTLLLAVITACACLTRYIGIVLFPVGAFVLFFGIKDWRKKFILTSIWGIVSAFPLGIWSLRNYLLTETFMGIRLPQYSPFIKNINIIGNHIKSWLIFFNGIDKIPGWIFFTLFSIFVLSITAIYTYKLLKTKTTNWPVISISLFIIVYMCAIIYSAMNSLLGSFEGRYLSPIYIPMVMLFAFSSIKLYALTRKYMRYAVVLVLALSTCIWLYTGFARTYFTTQHLYYYGFGFGNAAWKNSQTIAWLKYTKLDGNIYTNDTNALYLFADISSCLSPAKLENLPQNSAKIRQDEMDKFKSRLISGKQTYLIWFARHCRTYLYEPHQLQQFCNMRLVAQLNDGYVIALYPKDSQ